MRPARFLSLAFLILIFAFSSFSYGGVPKMINYQGKLTTPAGALMDTTIEMIFTIYDASTSGNNLWADTVSSVVVQKGIFSVLLGSGNPIPDSVFPGDVRYLGVKVGADPEMTPRKEIVSVGYAFKSLGADTASYAHAGPGVADNDWNLRITDTADTTLMTGGAWGIARAGNVLHGNHDSTHVNLGVACTTGASGQNRKYCTVGGGYGNISSGEYTTVAGKENNASGYCATVGGGLNNAASGNNSTVGGGSANTASVNSATVGGGGANSASGLTSTVAGGYADTASGNDATVGGGDFNTASGQDATVGGGDHNMASGLQSTVAGGYADTASAEGATVAGGVQNKAANSYATVGGGLANKASSSLGVVAGGQSNTASGTHQSTVGGGYKNTASGNYSTVAGGYADTASGENATVGGGQQNTASEYGSTVAGGNSNCASGHGSTVAGGRADTAAGDYSLASGYDVNITSDGDFTFAFGCSLTTSTPKAVIFSHPSAGTRMGINVTNPTYAITLPNNADNSGQGMANAWNTYSSIRWKENISQIENPLDKVMALRGVYFDWKKSNERDIGLIAEEVGKVIPEVVTYDENGVDAEGLDYARLTALLVEAIKQQQEAIESLKAKIKTLETDNR